MFSGIIASLGTVHANQQHELVLSSWLFKNISLGDSVAVDGVCLTAKSLSEHEARFDLGTETLALTRLGMLKTGGIVNLELALKINDRLNGHMVLGHIDGLATLNARKTIGINLCLSFSTPQSLSLLLVKKGSVALNGVSLTINEVGNNSIDVCLVPYTLANTNLGSLELGSQVHIEADILGRYLSNFANKGYQYEAKYS